MRVNSQSRILRMVLVVAIAITPHFNAQNPYRDHLASRIERASSELLAPLQPNSSFGIFSSRIKRSPNDDAFNNLQTRISTLARVVTGVSLYNGLVAGSIPVDNAIAELMNAGSISFQDLENFDKTKIEEFAKKVTGISDNLKDSALFEKILTDFAKMKEMWSFGEEMSKIPDATKFDELKLMEKIDLKAIEEFDLDDAQRKLSANPAADVSNIKTKLENIASVSKNAMNSMNEKNILTTLNEMEPFHSFVQIVNYYESSGARKFKKESAKTNQIQPNVKSLEGFNIDSESSLFSVMKAISSSRSVTTSVDRVYTSGLINGYLDLGQLPKDSEDPWILKQYGWLKLKDGLTTISSLESKMKDLNSQWSVLDKDNTHRAIEEAEYFESSAKGIKDRVGTLDKVVSEINSISLPSFITDYTVEIMVRSQRVSQLLRKSEAVRVIAETCEKHSDSITSLETSNAASIQNALKLLDSLKPHVTGLKSGGKVNEFATEIMKEPNEYTGINTEVTAISYIKFFNDLKKTKEDLKGAASVAELATRLRNLKNIKDFSKDITDASTTASASLASIQALRTSMGEIKNSPSADGSMFSQLNDLQKYSKQLGDSAALVDKIKKTLDKENELTDFFNNGHLINDLTPSLKAADAEKEIIKANWKHFADVSQKSSKLLGEIKSRKNGVVKPQDDKFESYGPILEKLGGLTDVRLDTKERLVAVGVVLATNPDASMTPKLESLKKSLTSLAPLDLTFAQYSVAGMTNVLTEISNVFGGSAPTSTMKPVTKPVVDADKNSTELAVDMEETTAKPGFQWPQWGTWACGIGGTLTVLCVGGYYIYRSRKPKPTIPDDDSGSNSGEEKGEKNSKNSKGSKNSKTKDGKKKGESKERSKNTTGSESNSKSSVAPSAASSSTTGTTSKVETSTEIPTASKVPTTASTSTPNANKNAQDKNGPKDPKGSNNPKDPKGSNNPKDPKGSNNPKDPKGDPNGDPKDLKGGKNPKESKKPDGKQGSKEKGPTKQNNQGKEYKSVHDSQLAVFVKPSEGNLAISEQAPGSSALSERAPSQPKKPENNGEGTLDDTEDIVQKMKR